MRKYDLWPIFYLFLRYEKHFLAFETEYDGLNEDMQKESEDVHTYNTVSYFISDDKV